MVSADMHSNPPSLYRGRSRTSTTTASIGTPSGGAPFFKAIRTGSRSLSQSTPITIRYRFKSKLDEFTDEFTSGRLDIRSCSREYPVLSCASCFMVYRALSGRTSLICCIRAMPKCLAAAASAAAWEGFSRYTYRMLLSSGARNSPANPASSREGGDGVGLGSGEPGVGVASRPDGAGTVSGGELHAATAKTAASATHTWIGVGRAISRHIIPRGSISTKCSARMESRVVEGLMAGKGRMWADELSRLRAIERPPRRALRVAIERPLLSLFLRRPRIPGGPVWSGGSCLGQR